MKNTSPPYLLFICLLNILVPLSSSAQIQPIKVDGVATEIPTTNIIKNECSLLKVVLKKQSDGKGPCCYKISLNNGLPAQSKVSPARFEVSIKNGNITDVYSASNAWQQVPSAVPPKAKQVKWNHTAFKIPPGQTDVATICVEGLTPMWLQYTWLDRTGKVLCRDSVQLADCVNELTDLCDRPLIQNGGFAQTTAGAAASWAKPYGAAKFLNTPGEGCFNPGFVEMSGNQTGGDAVSQALAPANKILKGRKYLLSVGVRFSAQQNTLNYARIRAVAYNFGLVGGLHAPPGQNVAIIGRSGKIRDCGAWSVIEFPVWIPNKDFSNIVLNVFTDSGTASKIWIDNVSLCEVTWDSDCLEVQLDANNKVIMPPGFGQVPPGFACQPEEEYDEYNNGSLTDLYGGSPYNYDGTTNWYPNASNKCFSLGGTLPETLLKYNCDDSLRLAGLNMTCDELQKLVEDPNVDEFTIDKPMQLPRIGNISNAPCKQQMSEVKRAFGGKDIIYIHGLELGHVQHRIIPTQSSQGALANWPSGQQEFYGSGFYKQAAIDTWKDHIAYFTQNTTSSTFNNYNNRYLVVAYNCSQRLEVAVHSVLTQIREAMENEVGVEMPDPNDPRGRRCFGREYVIISQSTGAMVADVMLTIAKDTKTNPAMAAKYGNIGLIADRCKGHIARRGAFTGSDLATLLVALAKPTPAATAIATGLMLQDGDSFVDLANPNNSSIIRSSILVDLIPKVARNKWGPYIDRVPVRVLTVAGGHPSFISQKNLALGGAIYAAAPAIGQILGLGPALPPILAKLLTLALTFKYIVHPGFDDGVITTDCANGRKSTFLTPSSFQASSKIKAFDMGIKPARAASYYLDQRKPKFIGNNFAAGATPYLSPTGMVQPVSSVSMNQPYGNHFSFIQAAGEHWIKKGNGSGPNDCCNYNTTAIGGSPNNEEQLVVNNLALYQPGSGCIDPAIKGQMAEEIRGQYILLPYIKMKMGPVPRPVVYWRRFYIWKRTYHKMGNNGLFDCDYVYPYLFKN